MARDAYTSNGAIARRVYRALKTPTDNNRRTDPILAFHFKGTAISRDHIGPFAKLATRQQLRCPRANGLVTMLGQQLQTHGIEVAGIEAAGFDGGKERERPSGARKEYIRRLPFQPRAQDGKASNHELGDFRRIERGECGKSGGLQIERDGGGQKRTEQLLLIGELRKPQLLNREGAGLEREPIIGCLLRRRCQ